ncbi:MAG TPA: lamin tail domain-containing protein, partial [Verrucomicrobiales bacterium]|nr:lamin tail domain-containing protein [Verrucomicrobiales bacterium]
LLHTRLYFNRLARKTALFVPPSSGTPGAQNSAYTANVGPAYSRLFHWPAVPGTGQSATVYVTPSDSDGLGALTLYYSVNAAAFVTAPMTDPDGDGVFTGTIPAQNAGAKVQFYVQAQDSTGATSFFPAAGSASRAIIPWGDGQAGTGPAQNLRITMLAADTTALHTLTNVMSDDPIGATVISRENEMYYDVGVWLKGSERGRSQDIRIGFNLRFPPDAPFLGAHQRVAIDRSGSGDEFGQKEILINHAIARAGNIPGTNADLIRVIAPRSQNTSSAMLRKAGYNEEFLNNQYANGGDGTLFEYELIYTPLTTNNSSVEGFKIPYPSPDSIANESVKNLGADPNLYRWHFLIKNNRQADDYTKLMSAAATLGLVAGAQFHTETRAKLDVDQFLRSFAVQTLFGVADSYATGGLGHNTMFYFRPEDNRMLLFPHDLDVVFNLGATSTITPASDLVDLITDPANKRAYYGHILDIISKTFNTSYLTPWATHYQTYLSGQNLSQYLSYINTRASSAQSQISSAVPSVAFAITTPGPLVVAGSTATLTGSGWVDIRGIRIAGNAQFLPVTWLTPSTWQVSIPVSPDQTTVTLQAVSFSGTVTGTASLAVDNTTSIAPAAAGNLVVSEIMYHPADLTPAEITAGFTDADQFEYVELMNISAFTVNLTGVRFTAGIEYDIASGTQLAPGARLVIARDRAAFLSRYPGASASLAAGAFLNGTALDNSGEHLQLLDAGGGIIKDFTYDDRFPWPEAADGDGGSLVLIAPLTNPDHTLPANWRSSAAPGGNPGVSDASLFSGDPAADADSDGLRAFFEYAIGTSDSVPNPASATADAAGLSAAIDADGFLTLSATRNLAADDVLYEPQLSLDFTAWNAAAFTQVAEGPLGPGLSTLTWRSVQPVPARVFARLNVRAR